MHEIRNAKHETQNAERRTQNGILYLGYILLCKKRFIRLINKRLNNRGVILFYIFYISLLLNN